MSQPMLRSMVQPEVRALGLTAVVATLSVFGFLFGGRRSPEQRCPHALWQSAHRPFGLARSLAAPGPDAGSAASL
jgi:hypothetical protein